MLERVTLAIVWSTAVVCTLFGAGSAHLPSAGTTILVALEIVIPPLVFRRRRGR
jgi:drug/metabolite transporter (DMT)-like permease